MNDINITALQDMANIQDMGNIQDMVNSTGGGDSTVFILSIIFGVFGMIYFSFGKKVDDKDMFMYSGIGLMAFPYFIEGKTETILAGLLLLVIPFIIKR